MSSHHAIVGSAALGLLASANVAFAQAPATPSAAAESSGTSELQEIVVTGSRIRRKDFVAESPIMTVSDDSIQHKGAATLDNTLVSMPQFAASSGSATQAGANQAARGARANLNLRGLGTARTLVLMNGRRLQPSDPLGNAIDLNTIPNNIISSVEIITGGASAVYGSDAVAGVVNLITKKNVTGLQLDAQAGQTSRSDGKSADISALLGGEFADNRGRAMFSMSIFNRRPAYKGERHYYDLTGDTNAPPQGRFTPTGGNLPSQTVLNSLFASYGSAAPTSTQALSINKDNTLFATAPGLNLRLTQADGFGMQRGNTGFVIALTPYDSGTILNDLNRYNAYGTLEYSLTDKTTAYAEINYTTYHATNQQRGSLNGTSPVATIPMTNPFLPADLRTVLASRPTPTAAFNFSFFGDRVGAQVFDYQYQVGQLTTGVRGSLPFRDWKWDVSGSFGRTAYDFSASNFVSITALQTLLNAADGGVGTCTGGYRPFEFAPLSDSCRNYVARTVKENTVLRQRTTEANIEGALGTLPAGEVRLAAGAGYRSLGYDYLGDDQQTFSQIYFARPVQNSSGIQSVKELYSELLLPVLRDKPLMKSLDLNLAYRHSDYNSTGGVGAYKASLDWQLASPIRLRAGLQRAVRAPSVGELYGGGRSVSSTIGATTTGQGDPCDITSSYRTGSNAASVRALCIAQGVPAGIVDGFRFTGTTVTVSQLGNPELQEETADTWTLGTVVSSPFQSPLASGLSLSVDYYNIKVKGAIGNITTSVSLQRCFNGDGSNPAYSQSNYFCTLLRRDANGGLSFPLEPGLNLAGYRTNGFDVLLDYKVRFADIGLANVPGQLGLSTAVAYVPHYEIQDLSTRPFVDYANTFGNTQIDLFTATHPKWKSQTTLSYQASRFDTALTWIYTGAVGSSTNVITPSANVPGVHSASFYDLFGRYKINDRIDVHASLQNVFNADPPIGATPGATDLVAYDVLGRRYSVGVTARF